MSRLILIIALNSLSIKTAFSLILNLHSGNGTNSREESDHGLQKALEGSSAFELASDIEPMNPFPDISNFEFWKHVGKVGLGSGVYLGDGYVLTSAHVGCYPFQIFDGSFYRPDYKSWRVLEVEDGTKSDLAIFRVETPNESSELANLVPIEITEKSPKAADAVLMMGTGLQQHTTPAAVSSNGRILAVLGYNIDRRRSTKGGFNHIEENRSLPVSTGGRETYCFTTKFGRGVFEAQASDGDSGGAAFVFDVASDRWKLAGCIIAVSQKDGFVPFGSLTFLGDLSRYRDQITRILSGEQPHHPTDGPVIASATLVDAAEDSELQMVKIPSAELEAPKVETCPM